MKAIETSYKGYRFRSRLEARWAVFFDALGLQWEYEPEGFDLGFGELYLPDFKVFSPQGFVTWYEVKPNGSAPPRKFETFKAHLERAEDVIDSMRAVLLCGDPVDYLENGGGCVCPRCGNLNTECYHNDQETDVICLPCDLDTPCGGGHPIEPGLTVVSRPHKGALLVDLQDWKDHEAIVRKASLRARSARFEHGARP